VATSTAKAGADQFPSLTHEFRLWAEGYRAVAGIDEAGRGAWAGPVVAAAVVLQPDSTERYTSLAPVRDSKLLSPRQRDLCYDLILDEALCWGVGRVPAEQIDRMGILQATRLAMLQAVDALCYPPDYLLIDAVRLDTHRPQLALIKGDRLCLSIAAASIVAKVTRDRAMQDLERQMPGYGFDRHKGYGTELHRDALDARGVCAAHRRSYAPIAARLASDPDD